MPNTTVLLVEDTDYNAWAASAVLARLGLTCERARTGQEALQLFGEKRFNVVLLDRNLPDMDGTEVARKMREMGSDGLQAVILAVTAYCTAEDRLLCLQSGMDAFVGKPLTPEKLRRVLLETGRNLQSSVSIQVSAAAVPKTGLDTALLAYLSDGSPTGLDAQIQRFVANLDDTAKQISAAMADHDFARLGTTAHQLLGQAKMVGGTALAEATSGLEAAARACDETACAKCLQRVGAEIAALTEAMRPLRPAATPV